MGNCTYYPRTKKNSQIILKSHRDEATQRNNPEEFLSNNDFDAQSQETSNNTLKEDILSITKTNDTSHSSIKFTFFKAAKIAVSTDVSSATPSNN